MTNEKEKLKRKMFMEDGKTPRCPCCGKAMKRHIVARRKLQEYSWVCDCEGYPKNMIVSVG